MRIVLTAVRYPPAPGGAETHVRALAEGFVERGHEVVVHTSDLFTEYPFVKRDDLPREMNGVQVVRHPATRLANAWTTMPTLPRALREERADIFHAHSYGYYHTVATARTTAQRAKPFIFTPHFHPPWSMEGGALRRALRGVFDPTLGQYVVSHADRLIGVSSGEIGVMQRHLRLRADRVRIIPNGFHAERFQPMPSGDAFRRGYALGHAPIVLFAGRLASNKGLHVLVPAFARVLKEHPDARLVLAGEDQGWRAKLETLGVPITFTGHLSDELYRSALAAADMLVLPSEWEAFGIVLAEAMACRTPCIATRVGGAPDVVADGVTGRLVEYGDEDALARAIAELLANDDLRHRMGAAGQARAFAEFDWRAVVDRTMRVYSEIL